MFAPFVSWVAALRSFQTPDLTHATAPVLRALLALPVSTGSADGDDFDLLRFVLAHCDAQGLAVRAREHAKRERAVQCSAAAEEHLRPAGHT